MARVVTNLFDNMPDAPAEEQFDVLIESGHVRIERIVSRGHASPEGFWYDQPHDEWVLLLRGRAAVEFEKPPQTVEMGPGDSTHIAAHERHRVAWTSPDEPTVWLAIHFPATAREQTAREGT